MNNSDHIAAAANLAGCANCGARLSQKMKPRHIYTVECVREGKVIWVDHIKNLVVNTGLDEMLDKFWKGSSYTAAHYVGLTDGTPTVAAGDTIATHAGWAEVTGYTESARQALTLGTVSGQSVDNSASKASYSINATVTAGGVMIATNSTKGGTTGILIAAGAFTGGDKALSNGDTLNVTCTLSAGA